MCKLHMASVQIFLSTSQVSTGRTQTLTPLPLQNVIIFSNNVMYPRGTTQRASDVGTTLKCS